jgi:GH18 family chitinase
MKGFDIINLEKYVDWFNIMTYDIRKTFFNSLKIPCEANPSAL